VYASFGRTRTQLVVVFAAATLLPLVIAAVQIQEERGNAERRASDGAMQTAQLAAGQVDDLVQNASAIAQVVEDTPRFWTTDDEGRDGVLAELAQAQLSVDAITFVTPDLQEHGASYHVPGSPRLNASKRDYARQAVATNQVAFTSQPLHALSDGSVILPIAVPVHRGGEADLAGLVVVAVNMDHLPAVWAHVVLPDGASIVLVDTREGAVLTGTGDALQFAGQIMSETNLEKLRSGDGVRWVIAQLRGGQVRLRATRAIDATPWVAVVDVPEPAVFGQADTDAHNRLLSALAVCGLTFATLSLLWWRLSRRFNALHQAAGQWTSGNWSHRAELTGPDELAQLGRAFDVMAGELQRAVDHANAEERRYRELLELASDSIFISDAHDRYIEVNARACDLTGYSRDELLSKRPQDLITREDKARLPLEIEALRNHGPVLHERRLRRKDGGEIDIEVSAVLLSSGHVQAIVRDVSARKEAERQLAYQARHDPLTGLANRALLRDRLRHSFEELPDRADDALALLFIDLDRFKEVNDTLGHDAGDVVLIEIGQRLTGLVRPTDTIARLGGDEFAILLRCPPADAARIAQRIVEVVAQPVVVEQQSVSVGASVGIALAPEHAVDATSLMRCADIAMYVAKRAGAGCFTFDAAERNDQAA
jgi:diguanylate cyclase (GGDEF)-like protein/PAS domain S-box-containing protein